MEKAISTEETKAYDRGVYATLSTLVDEGSLDAKILTKAAEKLNIDSGKSNPMHT